MIVRDTITDDGALKALCERLTSSAPPMAVHGLWGSSAPITAALLAERKKRPLLYITAHLEQADHARDDIETILDRPTEILPAWETLPTEGGGDEIAEERARLCHALGVSELGETPILVAPIQALIQPVPTLASLDASSITLNVGRTIDPESIMTWLGDRGFERLDQVEQPGDFAVRGGIIDIFASADADPVRLEFFGDEIESIRPFDVSTQRSVREVESIRITRAPDAASAAPTETTSFLGYLPDDTVVVMHEPVEIAEIAHTILDRLGNPVGHFTFEAVARTLQGFSQLHFSRFPLATVGGGDTFAVTCDTLPAFDANASDAVSQLIQAAEENRVVVFCENRGEQDRLGELVEQYYAAAEAAGVEITSRPTIEMPTGLVHAGFWWRRPDHTDLLLVPHHELFHRYAHRRRIRKVTTGRPIESFLDLEDGDYVVHVVHGIAKYVGMKTMRRGDSRRSEEFLTLKFDGGSTMHVPVSQIDLVQKYIGAKGGKPPLSKLGGTRWQSTKAKVEEAITDLATDLLRVQAERESNPGVAYPQDTTWQMEFENAFPYSETPDQLTSIRDIKNDQQKARPMDRLLCGDVGYGKTEMAARAAFKTVEFGKQVAILVPTTVLADQHHRTFTERMADYPFRVECLNRFRSAKEQREIIRDTRKGQVDILVGTHRLVSNDVNFKDLGLVIVDEEQRFGVEHKERLKRLRSTVDVLTLTATPIPRTLHMAMIGLRDISSLSTPPMDRRAISTRVAPWDDNMIREALVRELNREGQVYFVHNRVRTIKSIAARVGGLVPDARIGIGHGQMSGEELEDVMLRFIDHEIDILVCTTIIEAGLDIPNANTMLIDRADMFGLADLHQLRGRVGRYKNRAYCYLMLSPDRPLTSTAARRLKAIEEYSDLGAGFRIAMRDLEIRGAGNILGAEQSGQIAAVGYELYCQLLEKQVKRMRGETVDQRAAVHIELQVDAYIPKSYIPSDRQRMDCYRRLVACRNAEEVEQLSRDLADAFGPYPDTVETLLAIADIRVRAALVGIKTIVKKEPDVIFTFEGEVKRIEPLFTNSQGRASLPDPQTLHWRLPDQYFHGSTLITVLRNLFRTQAVQQGGDIPAAKPSATSPMEHPR